MRSTLKMRLLYVHLALGCIGVACSSPKSENMSNAKSVYNLSNTWQISERHNLSYCIDKKGFSEKYPAVKNAVHKATLEWETYADISFQHQINFDEDCSRKISGLIFRIVPTRNPQFPRGYAFFPEYFYHDVERKCAQNCLMRLHTEKDLFSKDGSATKTLFAITLHELGHVLGLEHAHESSENAVSGVKDAYSIMYYPWVDDSPFKSWDNHPGLSFWDKFAVIAMYPKQSLGIETHNYAVTTDWVSSGQGYCPADSVAFGLRCKEDYCKSLRLLCRKVPKDYPIEKADSPDRIIKGIACEGKYCSALKAITIGVNTEKYQTISSNESCYESKSFTDQSNDPVIDHGICRQDEAMTKINCLDNKCDNLTITCCKLPREKS